MQVPAGLRVNDGAPPPTTLPLAEGAGIFLGVVAWDMIVEGRPEIVKALLIALSCTLAWYLVRRRNEKSRRK